MIKLSDTTSARFLAILMAVAAVSIFVQSDMIAQGSVIFKCVNTSNGTIKIVKPPYSVPLTAATACHNNEILNTISGDAGLTPPNEPGGATGATPESSGNVKGAV